MSKKITVVLDANKLKGTAKERTFKNREGEQVTVKEIKLEVVPVKDTKTVYSTDKYDLVKTHFVALPQTTEERNQKKPTVFVGDGITTVWKNDDKPKGNNFLDDDDDIF